MALRQLPSELVKIAQEELNEDPKRLLDDIQQIKDWLSKQPHINARTDDQWIAAFLRGCKFSLERVKQKLDLYYTTRTTASDVIKRLRPTEEKFIEVLKLGTCVVLPKDKNDPKSPRHILFRSGVYDYNKYDILEILCVFYWIVQILVADDDTCTVVGTKTIVDYSNLTMGHMASPGVIKKVVIIGQDTWPLRLKGSHHVSLPSFLETMLTFIKNVLNEKAKSRLKVHKNQEEMKEHIPENILPSEYGGSAGPITDMIDEWVKKFQEYKMWLEQEEQFGTDESKRPGKPKTAEDMFGIQGSFRKLDLD